MGLHAAASAFTLGQSVLTGAAVTIGIGQAALEAARLHQQRQQARAEQQQQQQSTSSSATSYASSGGGTAGGSRDASHQNNQHERSTSTNERKRRQEANSQERRRVDVPLNEKWIAKGPRHSIMKSHRIMQNPSPSLLKKLLKSKKK